MYSNWEENVNSRTDMTVGTGSLALFLVAVLGTACADDHDGVMEPELLPSAAAVVQSAAAQPPDLSGDWIWEHRTVFVVPTDVAMAVVDPVAHPFLHGPITRIECRVSGTAELAQTGTSFSGSATQESDCGLKEGPRFAMPFVFAPVFDISNGELRGRSMRFEVGATCVNQGDVTVAGGTAVAWRVTGECEIPVPVKPSVARTIRWEAERP